MRTKANALIVLATVFAFGAPAFADMTVPNAKPSDSKPAPKGVACTIAAVPPAVETGKDVTVTLRVIGTAGADKTSINNRDLKSTVGGSSSFKIMKATTFIGRVQKGKVTSTCTVDVTIGTVPDAADCKDCVHEPAT